jgi:hypothetical protein
VRLGYQLDHTVYLSNCYGPRIGQCSNEADLA